MPINAVIRITHKTYANENDPQPLLGTLLSPALRVSLFSDLSSSHANSMQTPLVYAWGSCLLCAYAGRQSVASNASVDSRTVDYAATFIQMRRLRRSYTIDTLFPTAGDCTIVIRMQPWGALCSKSMLNFTIIYQIRRRRDNIIAYLSGKIRILMCCSSEPGLGVSGGRE